MPSRHLDAVTGTASSPSTRPLVDEPGLFDALRAAGVDADDPRIREGVRRVLDHVRGVREREGPHVARRVMVAMCAAMEHDLRHPDVSDMSSFEFLPEQTD